MIEREQDAQSGTLLCRGAEIPCPPQRHSVFASSLHEDTLAYKVKLSTAKREIFAFFLRQARGERAGAKAGWNSGNGRGDDMDTDGRIWTNTDEYSRGTGKPVSCGEHGGFAV